jgi:hypothetical protein
MQHIIIIIIISSGGVGLSTLDTSATVGLLHLFRMTEDDEHGAVN